MKPLPRCAWAQTPLSVEYHDREWGEPVHDDRILFEFLTLEGAQAGLSWETILRKREGYRSAFAGFDPAAVARFTPARVERLLQNPAIVRHRLKIEGTVRNARAFRKVQEEFGSFDAYVWRFVGGKPRVNRWKTHRTGAGADRGVRRAQPRPAPTRIHVRRVDDLLCIHAGGRSRERPYRRVFPTQVVPTFRSAR